MLELDGSFGEGGGQILRTALSLSLITARPFRIVNLRARRSKPGLRPQHLAAVRAAAAIGRAKVLGDRLGSTELVFHPGAVRPGRYRFSVGTAGSTSLVFQTVFLPLALKTEDASELVLEGGTHVPMSPSLDFLDEVFRPWVEGLGLSFSISVERLGFYPQGGGRWRVRIPPAKGVLPLRAKEPFQPGRILVRAGVARLPEEVAKRVARAAIKRFREAGYEAEQEVRRYRAPSPGAFVFIRLEGRPGPAGFTALGARGKPAERVGEEAARAALRFLARGAPVEAHLADQLLLPLAFASRESAFRVEERSAHLETQAWLISKFLPVEIELRGNWIGIRPGR